MKESQKEEQTEGLTDRQKDRHIIERVERDHRGTIFAFLYTIIKNKLDNIFNQGKIDAIAIPFTSHHKKFSAGWVW